MIKRVFESGVVFLSLLLIFSTYLGYLNYLSFFSSIFLIIFCLIATGFFRKIFFSKEKLVKPQVLFIVVLVLFVAFFLFLSFPEFVFPTTCSDVFNHARAIRVDAYNGGFDLPKVASNQFSFLQPHSYPNGFYALAIPFFFIFNNSYLTITFFELLLFILVLCGVYSISSQAGLESKVSSIAAFFTAFSITTLWILEQGFVPQLAGTVFLLASIYAFMDKRKLLFGLSTIGIITYPPLLGLEVIFLVIVGLLDFSKLFLPKIVKKHLSVFIQSFSIKESLLYFGISLLALIVVFPETIGLFLQYGNISFAKDNLFLIRGGIFSPNFLGLLPFVLAIVGLCTVFLNKKKYSLLGLPLTLILSCGLASAVIVIVYVLNILFQFSFKTELTALYQAVKFFYFLLIPVSILAAIGFWKMFSSNKIIVKAIAISLLVFMLIYYCGYLFVLADKDTQPVGYYSLTGLADSLPVGSKVGIDSCLLYSPQVEQPWIYQSLIDRPDQPGPNLCKLTEATRVFQFSWANYDFVNGRFRIYDSNGIELLFIGDEVDLNKPNVDYFLTNCKQLYKPVKYSKDGIILYSLK